MKLYNEDARSTKTPGDPIQTVKEPTRTEEHMTNKDTSYTQATNALQRTGRVGGEQFICVHIWKYCYR